MAFKQPFVTAISMRRSILAAATILCVGVIAVWVSYSKNDSEYRAHCERLQEEQDWSRLRQVAGDWKLNTDQIDEPLTFLAEAEFQSGNLQAAVDYLLAVPSGSKKCFASLIAALEIQFDQLNQPLDAVETLNRMIKLRPWSISSHQRLIFFYAMTLQRQELRKAIDDAINARAEPPDAYVYLLLAGKLSFSNGFAKNSEWLQADPDNELFQVARTIQLLDSVKSSDNPATQASLPEYWIAFEALREKYPNNISLLTYAIEEAAGEFDTDRVSALLAGVPDSDYDSVLWKWHGWLNLQLNQPEVCEASLLRSIENFPLDWRTWHDLAACRRKLGNLDGAAQAQQIANAGKELRKTVLQLTNASAISAQTLEKLASYAASCGDDRTAMAILQRQRDGQIPE